MLGFAGLYPTYGGLEWVGVGSEIADFYLLKEIMELRQLLLCLYYYVHR